MVSAGERSVEVDDARRGAWPAGGDVLEKGRLQGEVVGRLV